MPRPNLTDFATILDNENMGPLFDLAWGAFKVPTEDAVAKSPAEAREALELYTQAEVDQALSDKVNKSGDTMTGHLTLPATDPTLNNHAARKAYVDDQIDKLYPIGSIYFCAAATDPNSALPGTWTLLTEGQFLVSAGGAGDYALGNTGGAEEVTLTEAQMPSHDHAPSSGAFVINDFPNVTELNLLGASGYTNANSYNTSETGGDQPHENRPPFLAVNMWQRTA